MDNATAGAALYGTQPAEPAAGGFTFLAGKATHEPAAHASHGDASAILYDSNAGTNEPAKEAAKPAESEAPPASLEDALYGDPKVAEISVPEDVAAARADDTARQLYSPQLAFSKVIPDSIFEGEAEIAKLSPSMQRAVVAEVREIAQDLCMTTDDVQALRAVGQLCNSPVTDGVRQEWRAEATKRLNAIYGAGAQSAYQDAVRFVQRDPRLVKALEHGGRGDHPDAVVLFAKMAKQAKAAGRLK